MARFSPTFPSKINLGRCHVLYLELGRYYLEVGVVVTIFLGEVARLQSWHNRHNRKSTSLHGESAHFGLLSVQQAG